jgi:hypothetical protein
MVQKIKKRILPDPLPFTENLATTFILRNKNAGRSPLFSCILEPLSGFEPLTPTLPWWCSTC